MIKKGPTNKRGSVLTHKVQHLKKAIWRVGIVLLILVSVAGGLAWYRQGQSDRYQSMLQPFYDIPTYAADAALGTVLRTEPLRVTVPGGSAMRMLYVTETPAGKRTVSSGMIFIPSQPAPAEGRKVLAWAHGTLGFGDECTPSRSQNKPLGDMDNWLAAAMARNWVVVATDYAGIGTAGNPNYLIGQSEMRDVVNSVRAARLIADAHASTDYVVWGHSQGGHSALYTGMIGQTYAPELHLVAVAAAAPAAELPALFNQQYSSVVAWVIGPDAALSWPQTYTDLNLDSVLSPKARGSYAKLAKGCVQKQVSTLGLKQAFHERFFIQNPMQDPAWFRASTAQKIDASKISVPIYVAQGLDDVVVLPNTTALFAKHACQGGAAITVSWLGNTGHLPVAMTAGIDVVEWLSDRFDDREMTTTCHQTPPITPAEEPKNP